MTLGAGTESALITDVAFWVIAVSTVVAALAVVQLKDVFRAALFLVVCFLGVAGMFVLLRAEFLAIVQVLIYVGAISVLIIFAILMTRDVEQGNPSNRLRIPAALLALLFLAATASVALGTDWDIIDDRIPEVGVIEGAESQGGRLVGAAAISVAPDSTGGDQTIREIAARSSDRRSTFTNSVPPAGGGPQASSERAKLSEETARMVEEVYSNTVPKLADMLLRDFVLAFEVASVLLLAAIIGALALVREG